MNSRDSGAVRLSARELLYLRNAAFLPNDLMEVIAMATSADNGDELTVSVSPEVAERFRDIFTERLARVGFDEEYRPTSEGELLEALIDHFYTK